MTVVRGCGTRDKGGIYAEVLLSPDGMPMEYFLLDPPRVVDTDALGITPRGVRLIQVNGVYHIFDWVGSNYYPNVADFVEEARRFGVSRKLNPRLDFSKLTLGSRLVLLHARAHIDNWRAYKDEEVDCPKSIEGHQCGVEKEMCIKFWWQDVEGGEKDNMFDMRHVRRAMPSFDYFARAKPEKVEPRYKVAIFASFPIHRLGVIKDPQAKKHDTSMAAAKNSTLPVELLDE